jgi:hypothetical protein
VVRVAILDFEDAMELQDLTRAVRFGNVERPDQLDLAGRDGRQVGGVRSDHQLGVRQREGLLHLRQLVQPRVQVDVDAFGERFEPGGELLGVHGRDDLSRSIPRSRE